jgi:hypothetical protein
MFVAERKGAIMKAAVAILKIVSNRKSETIKITVDGETIEVPISPELKAHWKNQFYRSAPTDGFKKRMRTLRALMIAAYKAGRDSN